MESEIGAARSPNTDEESRIADTAIAIRKAVAAGTQNGLFAVDLSVVQFSLAIAEGEAFRATFAGENSFRGRLTDVFIDSASVYARLLIAFHEFKQVQNSSYLWQPKAQSLRFLLPRATQALDKSSTVLTTA